MGHRETQERARDLTAHQALLGAVAGFQMDDHILRERAREAIESGKLPARSPDRIMGGPGCGDACALCGETVWRNRMELEPEFRDGEAPELHTYHLHPRCFMAWECEREGSSAGLGELA